MTDSLFDGNLAWGNNGGGMYIFGNDGSIIIRDTVFYGNAALYGEECTSLAVPTI